MTAIIPQMKLVRESLIAMDDTGKNTLKRLDIAIKALDDDEWWTEFKKGKKK